MNSISNLQSTGTQYQNELAGTSAAAETSTATESDDETSTTDTPSDVALSTRAQKIQALNEEFFPGGPSSVTITDAFIQRLQEYGFISGEESRSLSANLAANNTETEALPLDELTTATASLIEELQTQDADASFVETLNQALTVLDSFDDFSSTTTELYQLSDSLQSLQSDDSVSLNTTQQQTLKNLELTLSVVASMSPDEISTSGVNQYLAVLNL